MTKTDEDTQATIAITRNALTRNALTRNDLTRNALTRLHKKMLVYNICKKHGIKMTLFSY